MKVLSVLRKNVFRTNLEIKEEITLKEVRSLEVVSITKATTNLQVDYSSKP
jgi:hypothetical protein